MNPEPELTAGGGAPLRPLTDREQQILRAVVHAYVTTVEPVGSRTIVKRFDLDLSPATVRNVMADLEESGYLEQLHTSSGRVPTDRGYRYFVDYLMRVQELTSAEQQRIEHELSAQLNDMDDVMRHTSQLLALVTHQAGLVSGPDESSAEVRRIDLMPMSGTRVAVLIADNLGRVRTMMAGLDEPLQADELARLARFLNENLEGAPLDKLSATVASRMHSYLDEQRRLAERALSVLDMLPKNRQSQLYLEGATQLFEQPEFRDVGMAREVFSMLDERDRLLELLRSGVESAGCSVLIGSESRGQGMQEISVVASPYCVGDKPVGMLGVLGPRRMPYPRLMAIVDYTAGMLGRFLTRFAQ